MVHEYSSYVVGNLFEEAAIGSIKRLAFLENAKFSEKYELVPKIYTDLYFKNGLEALGLGPNTAIECKTDFAGLRSSRILEAFRNRENPDGITLVLFVLRDDFRQREKILSGLENVRFAEDKDYIRLIEAFPELWKPLKNINERYSRISKYIKWVSVEISESARFKNNEDRLKAMIAGARDSAGQKKVSVILGNGVSIPFGSDSWDKMINNLSDYLSPVHIDNVRLMRSAIGDNSYSAALFAKNILKQNDKYLDALYYSIYRKYHKSYHGPDTIVHAVSEIIRRCRDFIEIGTFNYDSFVENDFWGPVPRSRIEPIYKYGQYYDDRYFPLFHLHGYLPASFSQREYERQEYQDTIVLTLNDYFERYSDKNSFTYATQKHLYENEVCLFVGSSMTDIFQLQCMREVEGKEYFAILRRDKNMSDKDYLQLTYYYNAKNITPISVDDYSEISGLLLRLFDITEKIK